MIWVAAFIAFVVAQGAAVFSTAWLGLRFLRRSGGPAKGLAIGSSYVGWIGMTVGGYCLLGGDGGLMDGMGFLLFLCLTCAVSSLAYLNAWTAPGLWKTA